MGRTAAINTRELDGIVDSNLFDELCLGRSSVINNQHGDGSPIEICDSVSLGTKNMMELPE